MAEPALSDRDRIYIEKLTELEPMSDRELLFLQAQENGGKRLAIDAILYERQKKRQESLLDRVETVDRRIANLEKVAARPEQKTWNFWLTLIAASAAVAALFPTCHPAATQSRVGDHAAKQPTQSSHQLAPSNPADGTDKPHSSPSALSPGPPPPVTAAPSQDANRAPSDTLPVKTDSPPPPPVKKEP